MIINITRKVELNVYELYRYLIEEGDLTDFSPCRDIELRPEDLTNQFGYQLFTELANVAKEYMEDEEKYGS